MNFYWEDVVAIGTFALCGVVLLVVFAYFVVQPRADRACLSAGYPSASIAWTFDAYCVKRVDQTDVVVPLDQVRRK